MIKSKPDIKSFNKDPNDFLEGGEADKALSKSRSAPERAIVEDATTSAIEAFKPEPTVQKLFRLRWETGCSSGISKDGQACHRD